jgi:hypothetical protein
LIDPNLISFPHRTSETIGLYRSSKFKGSLRKQRRVTKVLFLVPVPFDGAVDHAKHRAQCGKPISRNDPRIC